MEISQKDWKKYKQQIDLFNALELEHVSKLQAKANAEYREKMDAYLEIVSRSCFFRPSFMSCAVYIPKLKKRTFEGFLDWLAEGKPSFVKELKVKE